MLPKKLNSLKDKISSQEIDKAVEKALDVEIKVEKKKK